MQSPPSQLQADTLQATSQKPSVIHDGAHPSAQFGTGQLKYTFCPELGV